MGLNTDELLLPQRKYGETAFELASCDNHVETLKELLVWAEEMQVNKWVKKIVTRRSLEGIHRVAPSSTKRQFRGITDTMELG